MALKYVFINPGDELKLDENIYEDKIERKTRPFARSQSDKVFTDLKPEQILATLSYLVGDLYLYMKPTKSLFKHMSNRLRAVIQQANIAGITKQITRTVLCFLTITLPQFILTNLEDKVLSEHEARDYFTQEMFTILNLIQSEAKNEPFDIEQVLTGQQSNNKIYKMLNKLYLNNKASELKTLILKLFTIPTRSTLFAYYFIPLYYQLIANQNKQNCEYKDKKLQLQYQQHKALSAHIQQDFPAALSQAMMLSVLEVIDSSVRDILRMFQGTSVFSTASWTPTPFPRYISCISYAVQDKIQNNIDSNGVIDFLRNVSQDFMNNSHQNISESNGQQVIQLTSQQNVNENKSDIKVTQSPESFLDTVIHKKQNTQSEINSSIFGISKQAVDDVAKSSNAPMVNLQFQNQVSEQINPFNAMNASNNTNTAQTVNSNNILNTKILSNISPLMGNNNSQGQTFSMENQQQHQTIQPSQESSYNRYPQQKEEKQPVLQQSAQQINHRAVISQITEYVDDILREYGLIGIVQGVSSKTMTNLLPHNNFPEDRSQLQDQNDTVQNINRQIYAMEQFDTNQAMYRVQNKINQFFSPVSNLKSANQYQNLTNDVIQAIQTQFKF